MPTYDYVCKACGHEMELFQSMTEGPKRKCPACGEHRLQRLIGTGAALIFKGSGFYETDYRSKSYKDAEKADRKASEPAKADPEKNPDKKKPAPKSDAPDAKSGGSTGDRSSGDGGKKSKKKD